MGLHFGGTVIVPNADLSDFDHNLLQSNTVPIGKFLSSHSCV